MTLYENDSDRAQQEIVRKSLYEHLCALPIGPTVKVVHTPKSRALSHDLEIWLNNLFVGVAEVKCRSYDTAFFMKNGWAFPIDRLKRLRQKFWSAGRWTKSVALILMTGDGDIFLIPIEQVVMNFSKLETPPPGWAKADHGVGDKPSDEDGVVIPLSLSTRIPRCE